MRWRSVARTSDAPLRAYWPTLAAAVVLAGLLLGFALVPITASVQEGYFPTDALTSWQRQWLGEHLAAMREPNLALAGPDRPHAADYRALRVLVVGAWGLAAALRYEREGGRAWRRAVALSGPDAHGRRRVLHDRHQTVSLQEFERIQARFAAARVASLSARDDVRGNDGFDLLIETVAGDRYRALERWTPDWDAEKRGLAPLVAAYRTSFSEAGLRTRDP